MALDNLTRVGVVQVHGTAQAVLVDFTVFAATSLHPTAVAEGLETMLPYIKEVILIDVALDKQFSVDVGAGRDGTVD